MCNYKLTVLSLLLLVAVPYGYAQKDSKVYDNSVWYNARRGESNAMNQLGVWYYSGNKVERDYRQAFEWWRRAALQQNVKAIANLGVCYQYGRGVERDSVAAMDLYITAIQRGQTELLDQRKANTPGNTFDDMLVAACYERGIGTLRDPAKAAELYSYVADRGSMDAMMGAYRTLLAAGKPLDALKYLEKASAKGNVYATYLVGKMRLGNMGVNADKPVAVENIRKAAEASVPEAQTALGSLYLSGEAIGQDLKQALRWLQAGAQGGDAEGMWQYGQALRQAKDFDRAVFWMAQAVQAGYGDKFKEMYTHLPKNDPFRQYISGLYYAQVLNSPTRALEDLRAAAKSHIDDAKVVEAQILAAQGEKQKAVRQLEKLADENSKAAYCLAEMYFNGSGVERNTNRAIKLYRQSANKGYGPAQNALADINYEGKYATADRKEAARLYSLALGQRTLSPQGVSNLSSLCANGYAANSSLLQSRLANYNPSDAVPQLLMLVSN